MIRSFADSKWAMRIFLLVLLCVIYIWHNTIFDRDLVGTHTWRQTYTQQNIDCFYEEDNNILHPRVFARGSGDGIRRMEFPVMQWTVAQSYHLLGQSIRTTRIACFVISIFSIFGFYFLLRLLIDNRLAIAAATTLFSFSPLFYYYMMNPLPDIFALCTAVWALYFYARGFKENKPALYFVATSFLCIATLAKLPFIMLSGIPLGYFILYLRDKTQRKNRMMLLASAILMAPVFMWYIYALSFSDMQQNATLGGIFSGSEYGDPVFHAFDVNIRFVLVPLVIGFVSIPFFMAGLYVLGKNRREIFRNYLPFSLGGIFVFLYYAYEINLITDRHDYYMLPFLPLVMLVVAAGCNYLVKFRSVQPVILVCLVAAPFLAQYETGKRWDPVYGLVFAEDLYKYRDELRAAVPDSALCVMGNDETLSIMPYYIHKRGWTYCDAELTRDVLRAMINDGAEYMYTNSSHTLNDSTLRPMIEKELNVFGAIHVFKLDPPEVFTQE